MNEKNKKDRENSAPFIGLIPIPSLTIDSADIDFQMEMRDTDTGVTTYDISEDVHTDISSKWFELKVEIQRHVLSVRENTRTTDQTAKYHVQVPASQQPCNECLSKLKEIMDACMKPVSENDKNGE